MSRVELNQDVIRFMWSGGSKRCQRCSSHWHAQRQAPSSLASFYAFFLYNTVCGVGEGGGGARSPSMKLFKDESWSQLFMSRIGRLGFVSSFLENSYLLWAVSASRFCNSGTSLMRSSSFSSPLTMACAACKKKTGQTNKSNQTKSSNWKTRNDSKEILSRGI